MHTSTLRWISKRRYWSWSQGARGLDGAGQNGIVGTTEIRRYCPSTITNQRKQRIQGKLKKKTKKNMGHVWFFFHYFPSCMYYIGYFFLVSPLWCSECLFHRFTLSMLSAYCSIPCGYIVLMYRRLYVRLYSLTCSSVLASNINWWN